MKHQFSDLAPSSTSSDTSAASMAAQLLGGLSIALGLGEVLLPRDCAALAGIHNRPTIVRVLGVRELLVGAGLLRSDHPAPWLWARVAGDLFDIAVVRGLGRRGERARGWNRVALGTLLAVTVADIAAACAASRGGGAVLGMRAIEVHESITVNRPADELYQFWRDLKNLPRFMLHIESVEGDEERSHWVARGPLGTQCEWDAVMTDDAVGRRIAWRTLEGSEIASDGEVEFVPAPKGRGTYVRVHLTVSPPGGALGRQVAQLFGGAPKQVVTHTLRAFKQLMETGEIATTDGQPSGRRRTRSIARLGPPHPARDPSSTIDAAATAFAQ